MPKVVAPKTKTVYQLDSPYAEPVWPQISTSSQETILDLLVDLLTPIGQYRQQHITSSKGKRQKKVKRREFVIACAPKSDIPPPPTVLSDVLVGLNTVTRHLSTSSQASCPSTIQSSADVDVDAEKPAPKNHLAVVFTTRAPSSPLTTHLPLLLQTASLSHSDLPPTRLITLSPKAEAKICAALHVPRAGFIGVLESAASCKAGEALLEYARENVEEMKVGDWLKEGLERYREARIVASQVPVPPVTEKGEKKK